LRKLKKVIRFYYKSLYSIKQENLEEMNDFLDRYKVSKLNQDQINHLNNPTTPEEIETVFRFLSTQKSSGPNILV
jgi:predicted transcriptional regulator